MWTVKNGALVYVPPRHTKPVGSALGTGRVLDVVTLIERAR